MRVLVVEDEPLIAEVVARALAREGLTADVVGDGDAALRAVSAEPYDLVVLDLLLPGRGGLEVCREIRRSDGRTPIIMLTARDALEDKVLGLDSGADDYVTKPFELEELLARIRSLLRRVAADPGADWQATRGCADALARSAPPRPAPPSRLETGGLIVDGSAREVRFNGRLVSLTDTEFRLLEHLMRHAGAVCRRQELLEQVWGYQFDPGSNVVDVFIRRLRHKLDAAECPPRIDTVRGTGYRFSD